MTTGAIYTDQLFTGQREMAGLGIYHYGARFFSPKLGRFLSADSIVPNLFNPQDLNRYTYVNNSPINYTDPSGRCYLSGHWIPDTDAACQWASNNQDSLSGSGNGGFVSTGGSGGSGGDGGSGGATTTTSTSTSTPSGENGDACDVGHCYESTNVVCPAVFECTKEEIADYALMFEYPGQNPSYPVSDGGIYFVFPAPQLATYLGNPALLYSGAIRVSISDDGLTLINRSLPTHIFHDGLVERVYSQREDGAWVVTSTGTGTNVWPVVGPAIDVANDAVGAPTFTIVDAQMLAYVVNDQILDETFPRWYIP